MHIVLWDTRKLDVSKDFAGGFGIGQYVGDGTFRSRMIRHFYKRDRRPAALLFAYLAAIFARLGHRVEYAEDRLPEDADLYVFNPSLLTLHLERQVMAGLLERRPAARVLVVGTLASVAPQEFSHLNVTVVKGEAEQLLWKLDEVLARPGASVQLGTIEDLDRLPFPDWTPFEPERFRIGYDFWRFPTALIQASRGCAMKCNYCPYIVLDNSTRPQRGLGGGGNARGHPPLGFPLVQVPRSAVRAAPPAGAGVGPGHRQPAAQGAVLNRDADRPAPGRHFAAAAATWG